jgi:hypothetical protein
MAKANAAAAWAAFETWRNDRDDEQRQASPEIGVVRFTIWSEAPDLSTATAAPPSLEVGR